MPVRYRDRKVCFCGNIFVKKGNFAELWVILSGFAHSFCPCSRVHVQEAISASTTFLFLCVKGFALSEYVMWSSGRLNIVLLNAAI